MSLIVTMPQIQILLSIPIPISLFTNITVFISDPLPPAYVLKDMHK